MYRPRQCQNIDSHPPPPHHNESTSLPPPLGGGVGEVFHQIFDSEFQYVIKKINPIRSKILSKWKSKNNGKEVHNIINHREI